MNSNSDYQKQKNAAYPTVAALILNGGIILIKASKVGEAQVQTWTRKPIKALSKRSLDRLALVALSTSKLYRSLLTLSYGQNYPRSGKVVKVDIKKVLQWLNKRGNKDYLWFVEFQDRNAPHIHFLLDLGNEEIKNYHTDLARFWSHLASDHNWEYCSIRWNRKEKKLKRYGTKDYMTRDAIFSVNSNPQNWEILRSIDGGARYAMKYAMKKEQKIVPKSFSDIGRFWATPQHLSLPNLVKGWTYTDEDGIIAMLETMGRDFSNWQYIPKIVLGSTTEICQKLGLSV